MAFNGSGTFNLVSGNPVVTGTTISSTWANNTLSDIASGLSNVLCKDGQSTPTANLPMGNFKLTGLAAGTSNGDSVRYEQVTSAVAITGGTINGAVIGGTTPAAGTFTALTATSGTLNNIAIGGTTPNTGAFTTLSASGDVTFSGTSFVKIPSGTTAQRPGSPVVGEIRYNSSTNEFEGYAGSSPSWLPVGGSVISNDTSTATAVYPVFANATSGTAITIYTSNANYLYTPSTGELKSKSFNATNGIVSNSATIATSVTIASGDNAGSFGPISVSSGVTVTVSTGSVWTVV